MNELGKRIITALILVVAVWAWYFHANTLWFGYLLAALGVVATVELVQLMKLRWPLLYIIASLPLWYTVTSQPDPRYLMLIGLAWFALFVLGSRTEGRSFSHFVAAFWLFSWLYMMVLAVSVTHSSDAGQSLIIGACLSVWASDIGAYFAGKQFGKHKLCPAISPGKSIEGAIAGLIIGVAVAVSYWSQQHLMALLPALLLAVVVVLAGMLGDLSESAVKRSIGAKDSGRLLPGHGGILDRIDAMLMALPVAWLLWEFV